MAAVYPGSVRSFTTKVNNVDIIDAAHPNLLQEEVVAIQSTLGTNPQVSSGLSGTYVGVSTEFATLDDRLTNIEKGITGDVHNQYAKLAGGSIITASGSAVVPLTIKGAVGQTANLQEWRDSNNNVVAAILADGTISDASAVAEHDNIYVISWVFG